MRSQSSSNSEGPSVTRRWCPLDADTLFTLFMERVEPWVTSWESQSAAQLIDATKNFTQDHKVDFSKLPPELLFHIASYVAIPIERENTGGRICFGSELSTFRLTCHAFARAGELAMRSAMRKSDFTLYLPGTCNTLDDIVKMFIGTGFGQLVPKVVITMQPELDFMRLEQVIKCFCERWGTRPQYSSFTLFKAQKFILEIHVKRCLAQTRLVAELKTSKGQATFAALLHGMPRLDGLGLQNVDFIDSELAAEYFNGSFSNKRPHVSSMYSHQHLTYCDVVPLILPHLHHFTNLALDADGSIFDRASSTNIMSQSLSNPDGGLMNSAFRIKKINITLTRQEAMLKGDTHRPYDLGGAAAFATMLSLAVNLEELSLRCPVGSMEDYVRLLDARAYQGLGNASWLNRVLQDQHWPKLRSIEIAKFYCDSNALLSFFDAHQPSLLDVKFRKCRVASEYNLFEVVESMRKRLNLVDCSIGMIPDIRSAASFGLRWAFQYFAIPDPTYFNPKDPFKLRADPEMNNDDSERETMAAKVLAHYVLFAKPDWDAYAKVVGLQQDRSWMRGSIP